MKRRVIGMALLAAAVVASGCGGGGPTRADAIEHLESGGFTNETATCIVDHLDDQGYGPGDLTGDLAAEVRRGVEVATEACTTVEDASGLMGSEEGRSAFVEGLVDSGQFDQAQAECVADQLGGEDGSLAEAAGATDQMQAAVEACT